jgi:hypothetical protein
MVNIEQTAARNITTLPLHIIFRERTMADKSVIFYSHKKTTDGYFVSICLRCLATIARNKAQAKLEEHEKSRICNSYLVTARGHSCAPYLTSSETQTKGNANILTL